MAQTPTLKTQQMLVGGMDCTSCALKIESSLQKLSGVTEVSVSVATERLTVLYDPQRVSESEIKNRVKALGYSIVVEAQFQNHEPVNCSLGGSLQENVDHNHDRLSIKRELPSILLVIFLFAIGIILEQSLHNTPYHLGEYAVFIPAYLISGWSVLTTAGRNILRGQIFDETFLMTVATIGAITIHKLPEAVSVMLFYKVGELFQESAIGRSRRSIQSLLKIRPDTANLKTNKGIQIVSPEAVQVADLILVKPGERIPLDGEVLEGTSQIDTSALTGESVPRTIRPGEAVLAGTINQTGVLIVRVTKRFGESSIARILDLVENASDKKATTEKFITRFAQRYTPVVVFLSLAIALLPPLFIPSTTAADWVYRALILLVISCPCGLVISIPLGYFGGIGGAAKRGILIKGSTFLDILASVKTVVFDKTGTLTKGVFKVTEIIPVNGFTPAQLLELAAKVEAYSNHPVAQSIRTAYGQSIDNSQGNACGCSGDFLEQAQVQNYVELAGYGVQAQINGRTVIAGNDRLLHREAIKHDCHIDGTVVHLAIDGQYAGRIMIADELKDDALQAIRALKANGIQKTIMLTGDNQAAAASIANRVGLDSFLAELLPEGKVAALETILSRERNSNRVAFVGDGINDAPVIARADVGIAMGALGSDAAIETADIVLMTDAPSKVVEAVQVARKTLQIVWQNIIFAMSIKGLFIVLGIFGYATMWEAVFADIGVALMAILNAMRVLR